MAQKILGAQFDFSSGEVDATLKRNDTHPARKTGLRQCENWRILNGGGLQQRSGRSALFPCNTSSRIEEITMSPGNIFKLAFGAAAGSGQIRIFNSVGAQVAVFVNQGGGAALPWNLLNVNLIVYAKFRKTIVITFPGMRPQVLAWDGAATWVIGDYTEQVIGGQKRTPFYRLSPQGVFMTPSAQTGAITLLASGAAVGDVIFTPAHVGTRIRYVNRQIRIDTVVDAFNATGTVMETLPGSQNITFGVDPRPTYSVGDVVRGSVSGSAGIVIGVTAGPNVVTVQLTTTNSDSPTTSGGVIGIPASKGVPTLTFAFLVTDTVVGPGGGLVPNAVAAIGAPVQCQFWDDEVMNPLRGYPASVFVDQYRLGFCDFPALPNAIGWSAINSSNDLYVTALPNGAMLELAPDDLRVYYVVPGPEGSEFVFCDRKAYYIRIDPANPLKPGSVQFQNLSSDGCAQVQPRITLEAILYVNAGRNSVMAIIAPGAYYRPFNTKNLCDYHSHLFNNIQAIAVPTADGTFNERYAYVLNGDGSLVVGKYTIQDGQVAPLIGWGPWSGVGTVKWVAAWAADVLFTTNYFGVNTICEILDDTQYLDGAVPVNALPAAMAAPGGKGPLWWIPNQSVTLIDQVTRIMGTYQIDANGFIIPQNNGGENLLAASLVAGQPWTAIAEPFCPDAQTGADVGQRTTKRRVARFAANVVHSTGFALARLFSGPVTQTSPALGTVMNQNRFPAYNTDDDATLPPPQREDVQRIRPIGRSFDPRVAVIKDTPGPLQILELGIEATL